MKEVKTYVKEHHPVEKQVYGLQLDALLAKLWCIVLGITACKRYQP